MSRTPLLLLSAIITGAAPLAADDSAEVPSAEARWATADAGDAPQFRRHVVPLFSKLGCNMRSCHGSFQGQSGFRLSLFGFEPHLDREELLEVDEESEGDGPRADLKSPADSLMLNKPLSEDEHGGGQRFKPGSWQHHLLRKWIADGAKFDPDGDSKLLRMELRPAELIFADRQSPQQIRAVAWFDDGTMEDVTALATFTSNDKSIATVDADGRVRVARTGDTAIVAQYAGGVASTQVLAPAEPSPPAPFPPHQPLDRFVVAKLRKLNIQPSPLCSDEEFLRRAYLDVIGTLPTVAEARTFLASRDPEKRRALVDQLLDRPEYAVHWGMKFSDWTGNAKYISRSPQQYNWVWQQWLEDKLARNVPYDELVYGFVCATSLEGRSREEYLREASTVKRNLAGRYNYDDGTYARRRTLDLYWINVERRKPETMVLQTANAFLGLRLECAQCHNHPFDRWTQQDFEGFKSFFMLARYCDPNTGEEKRKGARGYGDEEVQPGVLWRYASTVKKTPPKLLGGAVVPYVEGEDARVELWNWMRSPDNPYFAPAIVNRLWAHYFGAGIVHPADDFNLGNPPSNPQLLAHLAEDFIRYGFDLKHTHRAILNSRTYQLSWRVNESNRLDTRNFSHAKLRRMPAEVLIDAVAQATGVPNNFGRMPAGRAARAVGQASPPVRYSMSRGGYVMQVFGRPAREKTCQCERSNEPSVAQALYLINDADVLGKLAEPAGRLPRLLKQSDDDRRMIDELYLAALSRHPTDKELETHLRHIGQADSRRKGAEDVLWSLLNVREFSFIR